MKLQNILIAIVSSITPLITILPAFTLPATSQQIIQGECSAVVIGQERGARVNMRSGPGIDFDNPAYVLVGQVVNELIDATGRSIRRQDNQRNTWQFVEYSPSRIRGWIRTDFLRQVNCGD